MDEFYELALFAGIGGGSLATKHMLGFRTVCYVENADYPARVIKARIRDSYLDDAPIWDDARTFDGRPWRGVVDLVTAGFPCQPFSHAGKRRGMDDERNLWPDTIRIVREVKPGWVLLENVTGLLSAMDHESDVPVPYFGTILADLAQSGYDARWCVLSAAELGAPHRRDRVWVVANAKSNGWPRPVHRHTKNVKESLWPDFKSPGTLDTRLSVFNWFEERMGQPAVLGVDDGTPNRVDRLKSVGNAQVPIVAATAWHRITGVTDG